MISAFRISVCIMVLAVFASADLKSEEIGVVYAISGGALHPLESHRPSLVRQPEIRGFSREYLRIPRNSSPQRFPEGNALAWTVRHRAGVEPWNGVPWYSLDLAGFELHELKVDSSSRLLVLAQANPYQEMVHSGLPLKVVSLDPEHLRLEPAVALTPGEYAVVYQPRAGSATVFCFGIDRQ